MTVRFDAFLGMSLDGFIAGPNDELDWLDEMPPIEGEDYGYLAFTSDVDALVMGRRTFETVVALVDEWPWNKPVVVMSSSMTELPDNAKDCEIFRGSPKALANLAEGRRWKKIYIDGGQLVSSFINTGLLCSMIVSILPVVRGEGIPLLGGLDAPQWLDHLATKTYQNGMVQLTYERKSLEVSAT